MTSVDLDRYFERELRNMKELISEFNTYSCGRVATDLTKICIIFEFPVGVFIGEFLEDIFNELESLKEYNLKDKAKEEIIDKIKDLLSYLLNNLHILFSNTLSEDIIKKMIDLRYVVTKVQIEVFRTKRRRRLFPF